MVFEIEYALKVGHLIPYGRSGDFVSGLERIRTCLGTLVRRKEYSRAVTLYEVFLAGCYQKAEEVDDSDGALGLFFQEVFVDWIKARQKAGYPADRTVGDILSWMDRDDYGFCYQIEGRVAVALNPEGYGLYRGHFEAALTKAYAPYRDQPVRFIYKYPAPVYQAANTLKDIYFARKDPKSLQVICDMFLLSPRDCERMAQLYMEKRSLRNALMWVEKGLSLTKEGGWGNEDGFSLSSLRQDLLPRLGRREEALAAAWSDYQTHPSEYTYEDLMKFVPKAEASTWHNKAMAEPRKADLGSFMGICTKTGEWDLLARRVEEASGEDLEKLSHYTMEPAAQGLQKRQPLAAAKVYRALGLRILKSKKSKYYANALEHFESAKALCKANKQERLWQDLVDLVRREHFRKSGFIGDFERLTAGREPQRLESFETRARRLWSRQTATKKSSDCGTE